MNTRFTVESATHIATFEVVAWDQKTHEIGATATTTMPGQTRADYEACRERQVELFNDLGFAINYRLTSFDDPAEDFFFFYTVVGNESAVLMSFAEKK